MGLLSNLRSTIGDGGFKHIESIVNLLFGNNKRWHKSHHSSTCRNQQESFLHGITDKFSCSDTGIFLHLHTLEQSPSTNTTKNRRILFPNRFQALCELFSTSSNILKDIFFGQDLGHCQSSTARKWITTVGRCMVTGSKGGGGIPSCHHGTNRDTSTQGLCRREDIWFNIQILISPQHARTTHAHLDFIANEECTTIITQVSCRLEKFFCTRHNSTFSLQGFHHDGCHSSLSTITGSRRINFLHLGL
mmetsp:Transcript_8766/g.15888  ORF Transcript_8766/g.15888 Transcript_8766/m.15888 type:complete len:247 (+) Transcript_8766:121-861(+)